MKIICFLSGCLIITSLLFSCKKKTTSDDTIFNETDWSFVGLAAMYDSAQIRAAKLALAKTTDTTLEDTIVSSFARYMLSQHTQSRYDLQVMGGVVGFTVEDKIDTAHVNLLAHLNTLSGHEFDSAYIYDILNARPNDEAIYVNEAVNGNQRNVRAYANSTLQLMALQYSRADSIRQAL